MTISFTNDGNHVTKILEYTFLVDEIKKYGDPYIGNIHFHHFRPYFESSYSRVVDFISTTDWFQNPDFTKHNGLVATVGKIIRLSHLAINLPNWRDPILGARHESRTIMFDTGNKRMIATALTKPQPNKFSQVLFLESPSHDVETVLENFVPLRHDRQLTKLFHEATSSRIDVNIGIKFEDSFPYLTMLNDLMPLHDPIGTMEEIKNFSLWRQRFPKPGIYIKSSSSTNLINTSRIWKIKSSPESADYLLEITNLESMHLDDLLWWMDLDHGTFVDFYKRFRLTNIKNPGPEKVISVRHF
jgi:hypothetical protein